MRANGGNIYIYPGENTSYIASHHAFWQPIEFAWSDAKIYYDKNVQEAFLKARHTNYTQQVSSSPLSDNEALTSGDDDPDNPDDPDDPPNHVNTAQVKRKGTKKQRRAFQR